MNKFPRDDTRRVFRPARPYDRNDPASEGEAVEYFLPAGFSDRARAAWDYLDETAFLFEYKGHLVVTDEALELTDSGDGTPGNPYGGPRGVFDSWDELETWLEEVFEDLQDIL